MASKWVNIAGGYDPFSFDITGALQEGANELIVRVIDPTDSQTQPRGKQVLKPEGIWYTAVTGIWQTVWLESTPESYIRRLKIVPQVDTSEVTLTVESTAAGSVSLTILDDQQAVAKATGTANQPITLKLAKPKPWSPTTPHLYSIVAKLEGDGGTVDQVASYFGLRKIEVGPDAKGITRLLLNGRPYFQFGFLDQGWWPDGLYTAPCDEALRFDIEMTKEFGLNMARKHVKVEPARWYYWCDKLGLLVWQDMPSGDRYIGPNEGDIERTAGSRQQFEQEWLAIIDALVNHPSIVMWVPFNEGWGQFDTARIAKLTKEHDPSRLVNSVSGWADRGVGDVHDIHVYPGPSSPQPEPKRAAVLGEFGGLGLPLEGHTWLAKGNWGYKSFENTDDLLTAYLELVKKLEPLIADPGLSAAVYTQTTDVEIEVNGLMTYDREVIKLAPAKISDANRRLWAGSQDQAKP